MSPTARVLAKSQRCGLDLVVDLCGLGGVKCGDFVASGCDFRESSVDSSLKQQTALYHAKVKTTIRKDVKL